MRKLLFILLLGAALSKLIRGRAFPPEIKLTSSAGFNALADPEVAQAAKRRPTTAKGAPRLHAKRRHALASLPERYTPGPWLNKPHQGAGSVEALLRRSADP